MRTKRPRNFHKEMARVLEQQGGFYTIEDILDLIQEGRMQSFADQDTWVITQVHNFPRKKVLEIVFVIGDAEKLRELEPRIEEFRKEIQAEMMMATGRLGWLKKHFDGWKPISANFIKV